MDDFVELYFCHATLLFYTSTTLNVFDNSCYFADSDYSVLKVYYL